MSWDAYDFEFEVRQGKLSPKLLRPLHPLHYAIVEQHRLQGHDPARAAARPWS